MKNFKNFDSVREELKDIKIMVENYKNQNKQFIDDEFGAITDSLSKKQPIFISQNFKTDLEWIKGSVNNAQLKRSLFPDVMSASSLKLGALSSPYLASALSILAERPRILARIFAILESNYSGLYGTILNYMGELRLIKVDDYFPYKKSESTWAFTHTAGDQIWPLIIEKSLAKLYGSYERLQRGFVPETIMDLTGAPFEVVSLRDDENLWLKMKRSLERGYFVYCSKIFSIKNRNMKGSFAQDEYSLKSPRNQAELGLSTVRSKENSPDVKIGDNSRFNMSFVSQENVENCDLGILQGFEYSIIDMKEVRNKTQIVGRILKLRNPWSNFTRPKLNVNLSGVDKEVINFINSEFSKNDDTYWITWKDFISNFNIGAISKYEENYQYNCINLIQSDINSSAIRATVEKPTNCYVSVNQLDERLFYEDANSYKYSGCRIMIGKVKEKDLGLDFITAKYYNSRNTIVNIVLEPGDYIISVDMLWETGSRNFNLSTYSSEPVVLQEIGTDEIYTIQKNLIKGLIISNATKNVERAFQVEKEDAFKMCYGGAELGLCYLYYKNFSRKNVKLIEIVNLERQDLELFDEERCSRNQILYKRIGTNMLDKIVFFDKQSFKIEVVPGDEAIIIYKAKKFLKTVVQPKFNQIIEKFQEPLSPKLKILSVYDDQKSKFQEIKKSMMMMQSREENLNMSNANGLMKQMAGGSINPMISNFSTSNQKTPAKIGDLLSSIEPTNSKRNGNESNFMSTQVSKSQNYSKGLEYNGDNNIQTQMQDKQIESEETELIKKIKQTKSGSKRIWNDSLVDCYIYNYQDENGFYILIENETNDNYQEKLMFTELENLKSNMNMQGKNELLVSVPPRQKYLISFRVVDMTQNYNYKYKVMYKFTS